MGSLENPLVHCHSIRDLVNRLNRIHSELVDHESTRPKCEVCWQNHAEFDLFKAKLQLLVQDVTAKEEHAQPIFEYIQLDGGLQNQPLTTMIVKEESEILLSEDFQVHQDDHDYSSWESGSERCEMVSETDALKKERKKEKIACKFCFKTFYQGRRLTEHIATHTGDKPFKCKVCSKTFKSFYYYTTHRKTHMKSNLRRSSVKVEEELSIKNEVDQKPYECAFCGNEFDKRKQILTHIRVHLKRKSAQSEKSMKKKDQVCKICGKRFYTSRGLKSHRRVVHMNIIEKNQDSDQKPTVEVTPFPCDVCKRYFRNAATLERHKEFRDSAKLHCDTCDETFCRYTDLYTHQRSVHKINTSFKCVYCDEQFTNFRLIYKHHKMRHPQEVPPPNPFLCEMCGISMMDSRDLNRHVMTIHESKRHKCDMCNKSFRSTEEVEEHRRIHIPISQLQNLYECDKCSKKFRMKLTLQKHQRLHENGQVTEMFCQVCGKRFINANMLETHMLKHESEEPRPHGCDICGRTFKVLKYLNQHRKNNHNIFTNMMLNPKTKKK